MMDEVSSEELERIKKECDEPTGDALAQRQHQEEQFLEIANFWLGVQALRGDLKK
jgi:hypothetical protein